MATRLTSLLLVAVFSAGTLFAQQVQEFGKTKNTERLTQQEYESREAAFHSKILKERGDLGLPSPPPVPATGPYNTMVMADRVYSPPQGSAVYQGSGAGNLVDKTLSANETGTGFSEPLQYQLPLSYTESGPAHPMIIAYHGYGSSCQTVALQSTIDEESNARGWVYMAPTGLDDQLFGSSPSQKNTEAAIQWMVDNFNVDEDQIYLVGFSMGGGVVTNFLAQHRDPSGLMFAAAAIVSGSFDWTQSYHYGSSTLQDLLEHPLNFGGPPSTEAFAYQAASTAFFDPSTYGLPPFGPLPGTLVEIQSMGTNLETTPVYITWDSQDSVPEIGPQCAALSTLFSGITETKTLLTSGSSPSHSWAVLDEVDLCDWLDGRTVNRTPSAFSAQVATDAGVSFSKITKSSANQFAHVQGVIDTSGMQPHISFSGILDAAVVTIDGSKADLKDALPLYATVVNTETATHQLGFTGFTKPPSYLIDATTGTLITGGDSDPLNDSFYMEVPGLSTVDGIAISEGWDGALRTDPKTVLLGNSVTVDIDLRFGTTFGFLVLGLNEQLIPFAGGHKITASPLPPGTFLSFGLNAQGDIVLSGTIPNNANLSGLEILLQMIGWSPSGGSNGSLSNMWRMSID